MTGPRHAIFRVAIDFLIELCKAGPPRCAQVVKNPLPDDTTFVRVGHDETGALLLVVTSEQFAEVPHGERIPELPLPMFERVYPNERRTERNVTDGDRL